MLRLRDFTHLPILDELVHEIIQSQEGLIVVAGWGTASKALTDLPEQLLPSGRTAVHGILLNEFLRARPESRVVQVTGDPTEPRRPKTQFGQVLTSHVSNSRPYPVLLKAAANTRPDLIVLDALLPGNSAAALATAENVPVLAQLESVLRGAEVEWLIEGLAGESALRDRPLWVISVMRLRGLCSACSIPDPQGENQLQRLLERNLTLDLPEILAEYNQPGFRTIHGCERCQSTGRGAEITIFDIYHSFPESAGKRKAVQRLTGEGYMLRLAAQGLLSLADILNLEAHQKHLFQLMLSAQEAQVQETEKNLQRRLVELEASNLVLQRRTEQLISLENISQTLIGTDDIDDLAGQVCRRLESLFGADYVVLYSRSSAADSQPIELEILALHGWDKEIKGRRFPCHLLSANEQSENFKPYQSLPPGLSSLDSQKVGLSFPAGIKAGLWIPLITGEGLVGLMVAQSSRKQVFSPGDKALLRTFANQTALALQRTRLQSTRIEKEKLERELEVARRLQQSLLPRQFPNLPGIEINAASRAARWVGGDFYDLFQIDGAHIGLVIGDASDKGIPAALYMALTRSLILAEARRSISSEQVLRSVNRHLLEMGQLRGFITVFFGVLDLNSRVLDYARAGHDRPILLRKERLQRLAGSGMPLGLFADADLELSETQVQLQAGDRLVLYTDGVMDVLDPKGDMLPQSHFDQLLQEFLPHPEGCTRLLEHLQRLQAGREQFDDMTLLCLYIRE